MKEPKKCRQYYKEYRQLDQEIKSNVTLYNIDTIDYHSLKKKEKEKIFCEGESYLNGDKKIEMIHIKDKNLNYKLKLEKLNNPKFKQKVKKMLNTLRKSGELVSLEKYNDMKKEYNKLLKYLNINDDLQTIIKADELAKMRTHIESLNDTLFEKLTEETIEKNNKKRRKRRRKRNGKEKKCSIEKL